MRVYCLNSDKLFLCCHLYPGNKNNIGCQVAEGDNGLNVMDVEQAGPADNAGIEKCDTIITINDFKITREDDLQYALNILPDNTLCEITFLRGGKKSTGYIVPVRK